MGIPRSKLLALRGDAGLARHAGRCSPRGHLGPPDGIHDGQYDVGQRVGALAREASAMRGPPPPSREDTPQGACKTSGRD